MALPETASGGNGGYKENSIATQVFPQRLSKFLSMEQIVQERELISKKEQSVSIEKFYETKFTFEEDVFIPKILKIKEIIIESQNSLKEALENDYEIERESIMNLFTQSILKLVGFIKINQNFKHAINILQTAVEGQFKDVFNREKILALQNVLELMKDNIFMSEEKLDDCYDTLENAGFNLNAPLGEVELPL